MIEIQFNWSIQTCKGSDVSLTCATAEHFEIELVYKAFLEQILKAQWSGKISRLPDTYFCCHSSIKQ